MQPLLRAAYSCALGAFLLPAAISKIRRNSTKALHISERFANANPPKDTGGIWINYASVGELNALAPLVAKIKQENENISFFATHSSEASRTLTKNRLGIDAQAFPMDFSSVMKRTFNKVKPKLCLIAEQELWPNMLNEAFIRNIPVVVVNARLSKKSARFHARWRTATKEMFENLSLVCATEKNSAMRYSFLGAPQVELTGNMKFDVKADQEKIEAGLKLRSQINKAHPGKPVVLFASTRSSNHLSEEKMLLEALGNKINDINLLLVPRHIERQHEVTKLLNQMAIKHSVHTKLDDSSKLETCLLGNTLGNMDSYIAASDVVFVGASLIPAGGQNPMEAFNQAKPVVIGPYMDNFSELATNACNQGAAISCSNAKQVIENILKLSKDASQLQNMSVNAQKIAESYQGAVDCTYDQLLPILKKIGLS